MLGRVAFAGGDKAVMANQMMDVASDVSDRTKLTWLDLTGKISSSIRNL